MKSVFVFGCISTAKMSTEQKKLELFSTEGVVNQKTRDIAIERAAALYDLMRISGVPSVSSCTNFTSDLMKDANNRDPSTERKIEFTAVFEAHAKAPLLFCAFADVTKTRSVSLTTTNRKRKVYEIYEYIIAPETMKKAGVASSELNRRFVSRLLTKHAVDSVLLFIISDIIGVDTGLFDTGDASIKFKPDESVKEPTFFALEFTAATEEKEAHAAVDYNDSEVLMEFLE
jgi:hypothetical protein